MTLAPRQIGELSEALRQANQSRTAITQLSLSSFNRILEHTPEDMVATVETGLSLELFQKALARSGQWLPMDPPRAAQTSIGNLLAWDLSGPRRFGHGTIRDHLIGARVVLADGRIIKVGGKVVKNVAGYDLAKLFIGCRHTLGILVEATFKLKPLPEKELFLRHSGSSNESYENTIQNVLESPLTPTVLELVRAQEGETPQLTIGFEGTAAEVDWQGEIARQFGFDEPCLPDGSALQLDPWDPAYRRKSVLPSRLSEVVASLNGAPFIARAGNGIIYFSGGPALPKEQDPPHLVDRVKRTYDPFLILNELVT